MYLQAQQKLKSSQSSFFFVFSSLHFAIIGEVKHNKKQAVSEAAVDKFVDSIGVVKRDAKKQKAICIFISNTGFAKKAIPILERYKVIYGTLEEVIEKLSL